MFIAAIEAPLAYSSIRFSDAHKETSRPLPYFTVHSLAVTTSIQSSAFLLPGTHVVLKTAQGWAVAFMPILLTKEWRTKKSVHTVFPVSRHWLRPGSKPDTLVVLHVLVKKGTDMFSRSRLSFGRATSSDRGSALSDACALGEIPHAWVLGGCQMRW